MDRMGADFYNVVEMMKDRLNANPLPITLPIGAGDIFNGVVDLIEMKAIIYNEKSFGAEYEYVDIPADMLEKSEKARNHLVEECASHDEGLLEKYLSEEDISSEEIKNALRKGCIENSFIPVMCGSAFKNKGVQRLLDCIVEYLPSPLDIKEVVGHSLKSKDEVLKRSPQIKIHLALLLLK